MNTVIRVGLHVIDCLMVCGVAFVFGLIAMALGAA